MLTSRRPIRLTHSEPRSRLWGLEPADNPDWAFVDSEDPTKGGEAVNPTNGDNEDPANGKDLESELLPC